MTNKYINRRLNSRFLHVYIFSEGLVSLFGGAEFEPPLPRSIRPPAGRARSLGSGRGLRKGSHSRAASTVSLTPWPQPLHRVPPACCWERAGPGLLSRQGGRRRGGFPTQGMSGCQPHFFYLRIFLHLSLTLCFFKGWMVRDVSKLCLSSPPRADPSPLGRHGVAPAADGPGDPAPSPPGHPAF